MWNTILKRIAIPSSVIMSIGLATPVPADDTELYSATYTAGTTGKPKVLVIFDDSGSMNAIIPGSKPAYDPNATYVEKVPPGRIYWNPIGSGSGTPPDIDDGEEDQWFPASANGCGNSFTPLAQQGKFSAAAAQRWQSANGSWVTRRVCTRWRRGNCTRWEDQTNWQGTAAGWVNLSDDVNDPYTVDCRNDVLSSSADATNASGIGPGFPIAPPNGAPDTADNLAYTALRANSNVSWNGGAQTWYTSHYINWYYDTSIETQDKTAIQTAQEVLESLIRSNPAIDFGLAVFNDDTGSNDNGGRVIQRIIKDMTDAQRDTMIDTMWNMIAAGNTPLCETAWEAYLYLTGGTPKWYISGDSKDVPPHDPAAISGGKYISPLEPCTNTYIVYMTDGEPTMDGAADSLVKALPGVPGLVGGACPTYSGGNYSFTSCLAPLSKFMAANDLDGDAGNGIQNVKMATIGFNVSAAATQLLTDTATLTKPVSGEPAYYPATGAADLTAAFDQIILGILTSETSFTSPAVAVDSFSRTESRDDVFFAMFEPGATADWTGNLKKLKIKKVDGQHIYVDAANAPAMNVDGSIDDSARTFWSGFADGGRVDAGGVGGVLINRALTQRNILSNTGTNGALQAFNIANLTPANYGLADTAALYSFLQVNSAADLANMVAYGWGFDVDDLDKDGQRNDTRPWIMADILHSMPFTVNYGARGSYTRANPDLRVLVGTNDGLLHMFKNDDGTETWAFLPKELTSVLTKRRKNLRPAGKTNVYGVDGSPVVHTIDANNDGTIKASDGDKAYAFFGLRRGGDLYYALDITDPENPEFMWSISSDTAGFSELGQTWSAPVVTKIPGYRDDDNNSKLVVIFGAGYDPVKDDHGTLASAGQDTTGRGMFIVDALTGALVWSVTPAANSATNMQATGLVHSIAADVNAIDSNGDSLTDRVYLADTGGNLWRVDLPGAQRPDANQNTWFITHLFTAVDGTRTKRTDRRFFNRPDVVRTNIYGAPADVIAIGTGDRTNPISMDNPDDESDPTVDEQFYMIRDLRTTMYRTAPPSASECSSDPGRDFRCRLPLTPSSLYDITPNDIQSSTAEVAAAAATALKDANGWRLDLTANGEKSLSEARTLDGKLEFVTFSPVVDVVGCGFSAGQARNYLVDLLTGIPKSGCTANGSASRYCLAGSGIHDLDTLFITSEGEILKTGAPTTGTDETGDIEDTGSSLPGPYGTYWDREDR